VGRMRSVDLNGATIRILPVVKGLVSEEEVVTEAMRSFSPDAVGISISKEDLAGLRRKEDYDRYEPSVLEVAYGNCLAAFGKVRIPPPCYVRALDLCYEGGVHIIPIDMNEEEYSEAYCENVGALDLMKESFFSKGADRKKFDFSSPAEFAIDWDRKVNRSKGFRTLVRMRERHMAEVLAAMTGKYKKILAVVECERAKGIEEALEESVRLPEPPARIV